MATHVRNLLEAALLMAGRPLDLEQLQQLFDAPAPGPAALRQELAGLVEEYAERGIELVETASGYRIQVRQALSPWIARLSPERPQRYSRAMLETLALIAYRQPITRGEIEEIRGVSLGGNIIKALMEREWIRVVGVRDLPGRPSLYGTTKAFLDYFALKGLDELPALSELKDLSNINLELDLDTGNE